MNHNEVDTIRQNLVELLFEAKKRIIDGQPAAYVMGAMNMEFEKQLQYLDDLIEN